MRSEGPWYEPHRGDQLAHLDLPSLLRAISAVESNDNDSAIGPSGERGRFQFHIGTWSHYGYRDFTNAHSYVFASHAATRYLRVLARILLDHNRPVTVHNLAQLWNRGSLLDPYCDFADRVDNLYNDYLNPQQIPLATS